MSTRESERERLRRYRNEHPDKVKASSDKSRAKRKDKIAAYAKRYAAENKPKVRARQKKWRAGGGKQREADLTMRRRYGIGFAEHASILAAQGGVCAICKGVEPTGARLNVDHCHKTGAVRGLLCRKCNAAIGLLGDDPDVVMEAVVYLLRARAVGSIQTGSSTVQAAQ